MKRPSRDQAEANRDVGISRAADRNERENDGWQDEAADHLRDFLALRGGRTFLAEELREDRPRYHYTRHERLQGLADQGYDTWAELRGER